jgi:hypothetical protein
MQNRFSINKHYRRLLDARTDPDALATAGIARTLGRLGEQDDAADPARTLEMFAALRAGGAEAQRLTSNYRTQLSQVGSRMNLGAPRG